jgi:hypothetical protein
MNQPDPSHTVPVGDPPTVAGPAPSTIAPNAGGVSAGRHALALSTRAGAIGARAFARVMRAVLGHRDAAAAAALCAALVFGVLMIAVLREANVRSSTRGPGLMAFVGLQAILVVATVAMAAHGLNPLKVRFEDVGSRLDEATARLDALVESLENTRAQYQGNLVAITAVRHEAAHHVQIISSHVNAAIRMWLTGVRIGVSEPIEEPLLGEHSLPIARTMDDPDVFLNAYWAHEGETLPRDLDCADVLKEIQDLYDPRRAQTNKDEQRPGATPDLGTFR